MAILLLIGALVVSAPAFPQSAGDPATKVAGSVPAIAGLSATAFYILTSVTFLEIVIILTLAYNIRLLLAVKKGNKQLFLKGIGLN